jgi:molybdate transport system substrate-binding protein
MKRIISGFIRFITLSAFALMILSSSTLYAQEKVYIYAAASTTDVVKELINSYKKGAKSKAEFVTSFGSSGDLARQIEAGADADIFISADTKWAKYLDEKKLVEKDTTTNFASNALVLVASPKADIKKKLPDQLFEAIGEGYLARGIPNRFLQVNTARKPFQISSSGIKYQVQKKSLSILM